MSHRMLSIALRCASASALATAGWWLFADLSAPDSCLDTGGAFDYVRWLCSFDNHEHLTYIDVPITALPSFPVFCGCVLIFVIAQMTPTKASMNRSHHSSGHRD